MGKNKTWINRLKVTVNKIRFLLNYNVNRLKLAAMIRLPTKNRRLSFNDRPGLTAFADYDRMSSSDRSVTPSPMTTLQRTISCPSPEDDVDKRAEMFIAKFKRQLLIERQISLNLRYQQQDSFGYGSSSSPSPLRDDN